MKKNYLKVILCSIIVLLCLFCLKSTVFGVENIEDIEDFKYIPKVDYVLIENDNGDFKTDAKGSKYFYYIGVQQFGDIIEITHKDGTKHAYEYEGNYDDYVHYKDSNGEELNGKDLNGNYKRPVFSTNQEKVHWNVATNNYATVEFLGIEKKIPVTIKESPVKSIKYIPKGPYIASDVILDRSY